MITILTREDLNKNSDMNDLSLYGNFRIPSKDIILKSNFIIFIDDDRTFEIFKNKYADDSSETKGILDLLKLN